MHLLPAIRATRCGWVPQREGWLPSSLAWIERRVASFQHEVHLTDSGAATRGVRRRWDYTHCEHKPR